MILPWGDHQRNRGTRVEEASLTCKLVGRPDWGACGGTDDGNIGPRGHLNATTQDSGAGSERAEADPDDAGAPHRRGVDAQSLPAHTQGRGGGCSTLPAAQSDPDGFVNAAGVLGHARSHERHDPVDDDRLNPEETVGTQRIAGPGLGFGATAEIREIDPRRHGQPVRDLLRARGGVTGQASSRCART